MISTRTERARVDEFVAAIRTSATTVVEPPTAELPRIVATTTASEPAVLESSDPRTVVALVGMLVVLLACLAGGLMHTNPPAHTTAPAEVVVDLTSERTVDDGRRGGTR
jgi:hypothetical protein